MDTDERDLILRLATAISDGVPIHWETVLMRHPALSSQLRHLQWIESLASTYRQLTNPDLEGSYPKRL